MIVEDRHESGYRRLVDVDQLDVRLIVNLVVAAFEWDPARAEAVVLRLRPVKASRHERDDLALGRGPGIAEVGCRRPA